MMRKLLLPLFLLTCCKLLAQNEVADTGKFKPRISGLADLYYRDNIDAPAGSFNDFTKFTNSQKTFSLGMASVRVVDTFSKVSAVADIGFGQRVKEYNYAEANGSLLSAIKELYISYSIGRSLKLTAGKWYKHMGYESPDADANYNYSMSYLFSFGPMFFTGFKADVELTKHLRLMAGISNPADITSIYSSTKTGIAQLRFDAIDDRLRINLNFQGYGGVSRPHLLAPGYYLYKNLQQYDAVVQFELTKKLEVAYNGTIQKIDDGSSEKHWGGNAFYINYQWKPGFITTLRTEFLSDEHALKIGTRVTAATLTANFIIDQRLCFMPEIRFDESPDKIFQKGTVDATKSTFTGLVAAVYSFGKKINKRGRL